METSIRQKVTPDQLMAFLREVGAAVRKLGIYPPGHPASIKAAEKPFAMLGDLLQSGEKLIFAVVEGKLVGNGLPLEDRTLREGLGKVLQESGLSSISFEQGLALSQFEKFLAHLDVKKEQRDLQAFIQSENIQAITVGKVQYQLVGEGERVVSAGIAESINEGAGEIQSTIAETLRKNPALLLRLLAKGQGGDKQGDKLGEGVTRQENIGGGADGVPTFGKELSSFSNEELLSLMVAALREHLGNFKLTNRFEISQTLFALKNMLAEREEFGMLPQLQKSLVELGMVDSEYVDVIFASDSSPRKVAHTEIQRFKNDFVAGSISAERVEELLGWLAIIDTEQYTQEVVATLYSEMEMRNHDLTEGQRSTMQRLATLSAQDPDSIVASAQLPQIRERVSDPSLTNIAFVILAEQLEAYYLRYLERDRYAAANQLLELICQKFDTEIIYGEGLAESASKLHRRMTSARITESLVAKLKNNFEGQSRAMTPLLENFNGIEPILVLTSYIANEHRGIRMLLLRLLSGFGIRTIAAFRLLLADRTLSARPAGQNDLPLEAWYRLRNVIFILSNIKHPDSVALVKQFIDDRDLRLVMESLNALERLGGDEAATVCVKLLSHPNRDVQIKALHNLVANGSAQHYEAVEEYFVRNIEERTNSMPALIKLDSKRALGFLAAVLLGEAETYNKYHGKSDEELNETVVSTFIQLRSAIFDDVLRRYVRARTRSLFGHFRKPDSVKIAERYLKTTSSGL